MKRGKIMLKIILIVLLVLCLIIWGAIAFLGRSTKLSVKYIDNPMDDLYLIHLTKPDNFAWKSGSYGQIKLPDIKESSQNSRFLTISSNPKDDEILILTHNSGSDFKESLTNLSQGSIVEISWVDSSIAIENGTEPIICFSSDVGIAATRPVIREWIGKRPIVLNHLDKGVLVFNDEMLELVDKNRDFIYETSDSLADSQEMFKIYANKYSDKAIYILTGQQEDVKSMKETLINEGINIKQIKTSIFRGLK